VAKLQVKTAKHSSAVGVEALEHKTEQPSSAVNVLTLEPSSAVGVSTVEVKTESLSSAVGVATPDKPSSAVGGVVAIKGDGDCCYHLAGVFALLCRNSNALSRGTARCLPNDTKAAREQILRNFRNWRLKRPEHLTHEEWDSKVVEKTGDDIASFEIRTCGKAVGDARLGSYIDLAILTRHEDIRVVCICTDKIFRNSSREEVEKSVREAAFPGETTKLRVVCAVLSSRHFDIGVVHVNGTTRAVFDLGNDWDCALRLTLSFIQKRSPVSESVKRVRLCRKWEECPEPADGCACGETSCECSK
jgi:hypothetical protein